MLVAGDVLHPDSLQVVERRAEPDGVGDAGRAGLEAHGRRLVEASFEGDVADHVAAALPRRHRVQQVELSVQDADPGRCEHLVPGERVPVAVEQLHVDRHVRHGLGAVDRAPARRGGARARSSPATGVIVPSALETWENATIRVRSDSSRSYSSSITWPLSSTGATRRRAPVAWQSCCQGTMLAWCSSQVIRISSPGPTFARPHAWATRLIASVVPRTNTISSLQEACRKRATFSRASSYASVARAAISCARAMDVRVLMPVEVVQTLDHGLRLLGRRAVV